VATIEADALDTGGGGGVLTALVGNGRSATSATGAGGVRPHLLKSSPSTSPATARRDMPQKC